jgi:hypothetical protein
MSGFFEEEKVGGVIAYYDLQDWWLNSFTSQEREYIIRKFQPLGTEKSNGLISGSVSWCSQSVISFLQNLSGWFNNRQDRELAMKILNKAEELSMLHIENATGNLTKEEVELILDKHFLYHQIIKTYYPERNSKSGALEKAIEACLKQIALAPLAAKAFRKKWKGNELPAHTGYNQLVIILKKLHKLEEATALYEEASKAGWA